MVIAPPLLPTLSSVLEEKSSLNRWRKFVLSLDLLLPHLSNNVVDIYSRVSYMTNRPQQEKDMPTVPVVTCRA